MTRYDLTKTGLATILDITSYNFSLLHMPKDLQRSGISDVEYAKRHAGVKGGYKSLMTEDMGFVVFCYSSYDIKNNRWFFSLQSDSVIEKGLNMPLSYKDHKVDYFICYGMSENFTLIEHMWKFPYYAFADKKYLSITNTKKSMNRRKKFEITEEFEDYITKVNQIITTTIKYAQMNERGLKGRMKIKYKFFSNKNKK